MMEDMEDNTKLAAHDALSYIFAGNAKVTLKSLASGKHFTYHVKAKADQKDPEKSVYFVRFLNGPNNQTDFAYLGFMPEKGGKIITSQKSAAGKQAPVYKALEYALKHPESPQLEIHHSGRCGRCGRELTDPESIQTGIGPICREKM
jgi:hypothetical protein